jgi:polygalacturonase
MLFTKAPMKIIDARNGTGNVYDNLVSIPGVLQRRSLPRQKCNSCRWFCITFGAACCWLILGMLSVAFCADSFYLQIPQVPKIPDRTFKLTDYGGVGDGTTMNTGAFAKAIEACKKAGGGAVVVPAGIYLTGPIKLVSRMALVVEKGAVIQASDKFADFDLPDPLPDTQSELNRLKPTPLITGSKLIDVAIRGAGTIDGAGAVWWVKSDIAAQRGVQAVSPLPGASPAPSASASALASPAETREISDTPDSESPEGQMSPPEQPTLFTQSTAETQTQAEPGASPKPAKPLYVSRAHLIVLRDCERVHIQGVTLSNSPKFHLVPSRCREVLVEDMQIITPSNAPNTDGIDPSNCRNMLIRRCFIDTGDDNIALKGGGEPGSASVENITVTDCKFGHGHGVSIGSETNAGVRNFLVEKCTFENTDNALRIKSDRTRGGIVENVMFRDITMKNVGYAITVFLFYEDKKSALAPTYQLLTETTPKVRNVRFQNITCDGTTKKAIEFAGLPESPIADIVLENIRITGAQVPMTVQDTQNLQIKNVSVLTVPAAGPPQASPSPSPKPESSPAPRSGAAPTAGRSPGM